MNTPAHGILNLLVLQRGGRPEAAVPVAVGAILPDLPMVAFYLWERLRGVPEAIIWSVDYYRPAWQALFDAFHSLPVVGVLWLVARWRRRPQLQFLLLSMVLHALVDLPTHREDAHSHFFPLSDWRFESPLSYWDPAHGGLWFLGAEVVLVAVGSIVLWRRSTARTARVCALLLGAGYAAFLGFAVATWG